VVTTSIEYNGQ